MKKKLLSLAIATTTLPLTVEVSAQYLEEIVVTSRKRVETVQDTPVSVRAISAQTIEKYDISSLEKVAAMSPEFTVGRSSNGSGAQLTMRGIGSSSTSIGVEQSVAVIVDDVYYGQGRIINEGMFDLERIELLKGPQALFFGKNATAGAVSLATADPTQEFEVSGSLSQEFEGDQTTAEFIVSGPVSETIGARLALRGSRGGDYFENRARPVTYTTIDAADFSIQSYTAPAGEEDLPGGEEFMGRFTLTADPSDQLSMELKISGTSSEVENPSWNYTVFDSPTGFSALNPANPVGDEFVTFQNDFPNFDEPFPLAGDGDLGNEYSSGQVTANIEYDFGDFTLTSVTNYQTNTNEFVCACDFQSSNTGTWATEEATWNAFSEEIRLLTNFDSPFNVMVGLLYQQTDREFEQYVAFAGLENSAAPGQNRYVAVSKDSFTEGETISPFFQGIWDITDTVELSFGARYTREEKDSAFVQPYVNPFLTGLFRENQVAAADQKFTEWAPEATINWFATGDIMLYAAYKTGYKSGGFSNSGLYSTLGSVSDFTFEPETAKGFEAGIKSTILDNSLRLNATVYSYEYEDLQVDFFNSPVFAFTTLNAGSAETRGIEIDAEYVPAVMPDLTLRAALNYNDAEYEDFIAPCWSGQTIAEGCSTIVPGTVATPGQDISGAPTAMAPEWTGTLGIDYSSTMNGFLVGFSTNAQFIDDYNPSAFNNPWADRDGYTKVDASLYLGDESDKWRASLIGKNLTDEHIVTGVVDGPSTGFGTATNAGIPADQVGFTAMPRTIALEITGRFW